MAHEITIRKDGFAEIAFAGETPWHGLGQEIDQDSSIETWAINAGMDWTIDSTPVRYSASNGNDSIFPNQNVLHRSDNGMPLSVVSDRYHPVQPRQVLEFFKELVDVAGFKIQVAGTLMGGKRMWAIANTGRFAEVKKDDGVGGFLLLSTSCDRTLATTARFTTIRVVCNNTLRMATAGKKADVSFTHLTRWDHVKMNERLMSAVGEFGAFMDTAKTLQKQKLNVKAAETFLANLITPWSQLKGEVDISENRQYKAILQLFDGGGKGSEMVGHTKWGMLNAVTEYYDHHANSRSDDARLNSAWFGTGDRIKNQALDLLLA
jgi:phage/plasmid-like protein (TIGR03299 family)